MGLSALGGLAGDTSANTIEATLQKEASKEALVNQDSLEIPLIDSSAQNGEVSTSETEQESQSESQSTTETASEAQSETESRAEWEFNIQMVGLSIHGR